MLVAGDIGGSKTDLAVYSKTASLKSPVAWKQFHSTDSLMKRIPVHVIRTNAALTGAALYSFERLRD